MPGQYVRIEDNKTYSVRKKCLSLQQQNHYCLVNRMMRIIILDLEKTKDKKTKIYFPSGDHIGQLKGKCRRVQSQTPL